PVAQQLLVRLHLPASTDQLGERVVPLHRLTQRRAVDQLVQDARGRLADRAAQPLVRDLQAFPVADRDAERDLVPAGGVDLVRLGVVRLPQPPAPRALPVVQDDLLVELVELHGQPNTFRTCSRPFTRASTSARVLYR